ncbi:hypothetical protein DKG75_09990 [Zavarzinia compransoris]|uniref:EF-hand domain-containing protein n=1 Tax=Zavarzinia compransoris TaxID=1264899 RepID=A0A317E5D2_9PROT|nr:hypothetical protein DKG75_09990 [Zavarzinia compransoris]
MLLLALSVSACAGMDDTPDRRGPPPGMRAADRGPPPAAPVTAPGGRLLNTRGETDCAPLLTAWRQQADRNRDGRLDLAEVLADTDDFFTAVDTGKDGFLTAIELEAYRERIAPGAYADQAFARSNRGEDGGDRKQRTAGDPGPTRRIERRGQPDPVMAADANLDFRVAREELAAKVKERFARLDGNRDGDLDPGELEDYCPKD